MFGEIHYWNESLHSESVISDDCCPTTGWSNDPPSADDHAVVWRTYHRAGTGEFRAYYWDGILSNLSDELEATMSHNYCLQGGEVACEYDATPSWIRYWDGTTWETIEKGYEPSLFEGTLAYEVYDGQDWEIRYWDGSAIHEITDNDYNDTQVSLHGTTIAWVGRPPGSLDQIFYFRLAEAFTPKH
jgi:hypothetical protein